MSGAIEQRESDGRTLAEVSTTLAAALDELNSALRALEQVSPVINLGRVRSESSQILHVLRDLFEVTGAAAEVLRDDGELRNHLTRQIELGKHISPHQLDLFSRASPINAVSTLRVHEVYEAYQPQPPRSEDPRRSLTIVDSAEDLAYQQALRNELAGCDVGADTFWATVRAIVCTYCNVGPGADCITSGGWPSGHFHRPRRDAAAAYLRQQSH